MVKTSLPILSLRFSTGGGVVTPQLPSPPLAAPLQPETEPQQLNFRFCSPAALRLTFRECGAPPPPPPQPHNCTTSPHRAPPLFDMAHPESSHRTQIRGIWLPGPPPPRVFDHTAPPPPTTPPPHPPHP